MDKLKIINRALAKVGLPRAASLSDCDWNAQEEYPDLVREMLREFPWNFAQRFAALTVTTNTSMAFEYCYSLPSDCLRLVDIRQHTSLRAPQATFQISGKKIYCNISPCYARYIADLQDPEDWTPDFSDVVAWRIAEEIVSLSGQKPELMANIKLMGNEALEAAKATDARESRERVPLDASIYAARAGGKV